MLYNPMQGAVAAQIIRRPMSDGERSAALGYFNTLRSASRGVAVASIVLALLNLSLTLGSSPPVELAILLTVLTLALGLSAMAVGATTLRTRGLLSSDLGEGSVVAVRAPAHLTKGGGGGQMWAIGPVSILKTPEVATLLFEGAQAEVAFLPGVKWAVSVNGAALKQGASVKAPPGLARMAQSLPAAHPQPGQQPLQPPDQPPRVPPEPG